MTRSEAGKLGGKLGAAAWQRTAQKMRDEYAVNPKLCEHCSEAIPFDKKRSRFCNHSCAARFLNPLSKKVKTEKANGKFTSFESLVCVGTKKKRLIQERGHKCESCLLDTWLGQQIRLTLDHTDGNSDNNSRENLKLLCWNCHSMTPTFGAKNKGKFPNSSRNKKRKERRTQL